MLRKIPFQIARVAVGALLVPSLALAAVNLKKVNIVDGNQIELLFDGKVEPTQVKTEFVRDNIQLSLTNASVYPAKVSMVSGSDLTKVFAYQYSPALVRARFTVKGDAATYANRLQVKFSGKSLIVKIAAGKSDQVASASSSALRVANTDESPAEKKAVEKPAEAPAKVEKETETKAVERIAAEEKASKPLTGNLEKKSSRELAGGKPLPSPFRSIGMMLFVLGVFGLFVMFLKRMKGGDAKAAKAAKGLGGLLGKLSGGASSKALIEIVATHHLAPKRSIVVVRIQSRMLVLGMTNDNMNLITEFAANEEGEADENIPLGDFAASLKKFESEDLAAAPTTKISPKANLGDIAAAALGLAKPKPTTVPRANAAASAYANVNNVKASQGAEGGKNSAAGAGSGGPTFSPALDEALKQPSVKPNIRAQIKDRVQGMKQL